MKSLVIIKGQLRTWEENKFFLKAYIDDFVKQTKIPGSEQLLFGSQKVDILFSCWDISYQLYPEPFVITHLKKEEISADDINTFFKDADVVERTHFNKLSYVEAQQTFDNLQFTLDEEYHLQCFITYKTGLIKRQIEAETGIDYDLIVELRPDVIYEYKSASKLLKKPKFGEIMSLHGNVIMDVQGMVSPMTFDLIFVMTGHTYNIFSKELLFHYETKKTGKHYTTAHVEKSLFYMANNFQVNDMLYGLCSVAVIVRPTVDWVKFQDLKGDTERISFIRRHDSEWRMTKQLAFEVLMKQGYTLEYMAEYVAKINRDNRQKIEQKLNPKN